jgi:hypothetical protein
MLALSPRIELYYPTNQSYTATEVLAGGRISDELTALRMYVVLRWIRVVVF